MEPLPGSGGSLSIPQPTFFSPLFFLTLSLLYLPLFFRSWYSLLFSVFMSSLIMAFYGLFHLVFAFSMGIEHKYSFNYTYNQSDDKVNFFSNIVTVSCISFICQRKIVLGIWHGYYIQKRRRRKSLFMMYETS